MRANRLSLVYCLSSKRAYLRHFRSSISKGFNWDKFGGGTQERTVRVIRAAISRCTRYGFGTFEQAHPVPSVSTRSMAFNCRNRLIRAFLSATLINRPLSSSFLACSPEFGTPASCSRASK